MAWTKRCRSGAIRGHFHRSAMIESKNSASERFIAAMSHMANTVNVVTTDGPAGRAGVTVSAMTSISADEKRPSLLICVHNLSSACEPILRNKKFCVNVLSDDQSYIADVFAGRIPPSDGSNDKFSCAQWIGKHSPRVIDPLVAFNCDLVQNFRIGTHVICVGEVCKTFINGGKSPLIYANRAYRSNSRFHSDLNGTNRHNALRRLRLASLTSLTPLIPTEVINGYLDLNAANGFFLMECRPDEWEAGLRSGFLDIAIAQVEMPSSEFVSQTLTSTVPHILIAASHPLAQSDNVALEDLSELRLILIDEPILRKRVYRYFSSFGPPPKVSLETTSFDQVCQCVASGSAYSVVEMAPGCPNTFNRHHLHTLPIRGLSFTIQTSVTALTAKTTKSKSAKEFLKLCQEYYRNQTSGQRK